MNKAENNLYPFKSNYLDIKKIKMHYLDEGSGEPLLMLHGNPTWSFFYRDLIKAFSTKYRCIVPDHIGNGLSDKPSKDSYSYTLAERADNIKSLVESLDLKNITLVVHDWGALIGFDYARKYPENIKRIIVLNSAAFGLPEKRPFPWSIGLCKNPITGPFLVQVLNAFFFVSCMFCVKNKMEKNVRDMYLKPYDNIKNRYGVLAFILDVPLTPDHVSWKELQETEESVKNFNNLPILICWADKDFVFDKYFLEKWTKYLPNAEVKHFPNAGHYILEDVPSDVIEEIETFLKKNPLD